MQISNAKTNSNNQRLFKSYLGKGTKLLTATIFSCSVLATANSYAVQSDPCGAVLCLSGIGALDGKLGECKPHVKKFFSFNAFDKKGFFSPSAAYVKRYKWLNQCKSANPVFKQAIMASYGYMQRSPW